ncbi:hypothetical protein M9H77_31442 [Catharanthus roseus]|uniref:Uncharacterized protein n=1 Tax=Catharanthus roseus TaxID=4058 RepID=A0ACC0A152_CATRO|nr:hypothetical protein M9H77_31442 [Catharanthus roseus]
MLNLPFLVTLYLDNLYLELKRLEKSSNYEASTSTINEEISQLRKLSWNYCYFENSIHQVAVADCNNEKPDSSLSVEKACTLPLTAGPSLPLPVGFLLEFLESWHPTTDGLLDCVVGFLSFKILNKGPSRGGDLGKNLDPIQQIGYIYTGIFKVASLMASGRRFALATPVLARIYHGLNMILLPIHLVYAWVTGYFNTHHTHDQYLLGAKMTRTYDTSKTAKVKLPSSIRTLPTVGVGSSSKAPEKPLALTILEANTTREASNPTMEATSSYHWNRRLFEKLEDF